ncbi:MAG: monomeric [FeFe] hydrogenase [Bacillota bacterium]
MAEITSELTKIRRKLIKEIVSLALENRLIEKIDLLPEKITGDGLTNYRCCKYKEQAILTERIKLLLGIGPYTFDKNKKLSEIVKEVVNNNFNVDEDEHYIKIIEEACDHCSIDKIVVTNACRNCVAHHCVNSCPKDAIKILENRAYIDKNKCVECGLCVKSCPYGAIIEIDRPCNRACEIDAIVPGETSTARINYEDCLECGTCIAACPFGAISYKSDILKVTWMLKEKKDMYALVAPSFVGQFGPMVQFAELKRGLKKLGFSDVYQVASGADMAIEEESSEVLEKLKKQKGKLTFNSCCPSFKLLINKYFPNLSKHISDTPSPMLMIANRVKNEFGGKCVFIGPCIAKRGEAIREGKSVIDAVINFEELAAMLVGGGINLANINIDARENTDRELVPSKAARNFCKNGGVMQSILDNVKGKIGEDLEVNSAAGINECLNLLKTIDRGQKKYKFVEGMGCEGGCLGGPGVLVKAKVSRRLLSNETGGE